MWSLIMEPGKKYITVVDYTFNLSMAILDLDTVVEKTDMYTVYLETEDTPRIILCHLSQALNLLQVKLDLVFPQGTTLKLYSTGSAQIHMTGYLIYDDEITVTKKYNNHETEDDIPNVLEIERDDKRKTNDDLRQTGSGRLNINDQSHTQGNDDEMVEQIEEQHVKFLLHTLVKDNSNDSIFGDKNDVEDEPVLTEGITTQMTRGNKQRKTKVKTTYKYQEKDLPVKRKPNERFKMTNELKNLYH